MCLLNALDIRCWCNSKFCCLMSLSLPRASNSTTRRLVVSSILIASRTVALNDGSCISSGGMVSPLKMKTYGVSRVMVLTMFCKPTWHQEAYLACWFWAGQPSFLKYCEQFRITGPPGVANILGIVFYSVFVKLLGIAEHAGITNNVGVTKDCM